MISRWTCYWQNDSNCRCQLLGHQDFFSSGKILLIGLHFIASVFMFYIYILSDAVIYWVYFPNKRIIWHLTINLGIWNMHCMWPTDVSIYSSSISLVVVQVHLVTCQQKLIVLFIYGTFAEYFSLCAYTMVNRTLHVCCWSGCLQRILDDGSKQCDVVWLTR